MPIWVLYALLSAVFASLVAIFGKIGIKDLDTTMATTVRAVIMATFLLIVTLLLGKLPLIKTIGSRAMLFIVLAGVAGAMSWLFYFFALKYGKTSGVAALDRLSVVFVLIFAVLFLSEKLTWQSALGALLLTGGAILMSIAK